MVFSRHETLGSISSNSHTMVSSETSKKKKKIEKPHIVKSHKTINIQTVVCWLFIPQLKSNSNLKDLAWRDFKIVLFKNITYYIKEHINVQFGKFSNITWPDDHLQVLLFPTDNVLCWFWTLYKWNYRIHSFWLTAFPPQYYRLSFLTFCIWL